MGVVPALSSVLAIFALMTCAAANVFASTAFVRTLEQGRRWSIGNDMVVRTISFSEANGLRTESLVHNVSGADFLQTPPAGDKYEAEFSFNAGARHFSGHSHWSLVSAEPSMFDGGAALVLKLRDEQHQFDVAANYAAYADQPAIRKWIAITNTSNAVQTLTHLAFERLPAAPGAPADLEVWSGYGTIPHEFFMTGRVSDAAIYVRNSRTGEGFAVINEAPGYLKRTEIGDSWNSRISVMYDTDLFPFERTLASGESFESAKSSIVFFKDDTGFSDPRWAIPTYMSHVVMRRGGSYQPSWIFNTWEPFLRNINQQTVAELAPIASRMNLDVLTIDDGWQLRYGSNENNLKSFPDGVDGVRTVLDRGHLGLGLWVPLAAIDTSTDVYKDHPEWACQDGLGRPKVTSTAAGQQGLMCLGSPYRNAAVQRLEDLIRKYRPRYLKVDLTTVFNAYGEEPGCHAPGHFHKSWAESLSRIYDGLEYIGRKLHEQYPEVLVDYTFELWGEKHLIDAGLLGCADLDWLSNVNDAGELAAGPRQARMLLYQRAASIPVETMLIGNLRAETAPIEERFALAIGSGPVLLGDLRKLTVEQQDWWGKQVGWYRELRSRASLLDSFFPLGSWRQPGSGAWDGFARLSRDSDGIIVLFRNTATDAHIKIVAPPGANYSVRSVLEGTDLGSLSAAQLTEGWQVGLDPKRAVTVLELRRSK